jgi:hypothetical protein
MIRASDIAASNKVIIFFKDNARKKGYKSVYSVSEWR